MVLMVSVRFHDSGEIWEFYEGDRITKRRVKRIIDNLKWFRECFPDHASSFSYATIHVDGYLNIMIGITSTYELISAYRKGEFIDSRRVYNGTIQG